MTNYSLTQGFGAGCKFCAQGNIICTESGEQSVKEGSSVQRDMLLWNLAATQNGAGKGMEGETLKRRCATKSPRR